MGIVRSLWAALLLSLGLSAFPTDGRDKPPCSCNELGRNAQTWRLMLCAKDPATWQVKTGGAWGELNIQRPTGGFELAAGGLRPNTEYALVRYTGEGVHGQILARGLSNGYGEFRWTGTWHAWSKKFWVVLGEDLKSNLSEFNPRKHDTLKTWHPVEYLFESEELN